VLIPEVSLAGWHVFLGDCLTGKNTLSCGFDEASIKSLKEVQTQFVNVIAPLRNYSATFGRYDNA
jgi:hypothetical protein